MFLLKSEHLAELKRYQDDRSNHMTVPELLEELGIENAEEVVIVAGFKPAE